MSNLATHNGTTATNVTQVVTAPITALCVDTTTNNTYYGCGDGLYSPQNIHTYNKTTPITPYPSLVPVDFTAHIITSPLGVVYYNDGLEVGVLNADYTRTPILYIDSGNINGIVLKGEHVYVYGTFFQVTDSNTMVVYNCGAVVSIINNVITELPYTFSGVVQSLGWLNDILYINAGYPGTTVSNYVGDLPALTYYDGVSWTAITEPSGVLPGDVYVFLTGTNIMYLINNSTDNTCVWTHTGTGSLAALGDLLADGFVPDPYNSPGTYAIRALPALIGGVIHISLSVVTSVSPYIYAPLLRYIDGVWEAVGGLTDGELCSYLTSFVSKGSTVYGVTLSADTKQHLCYIVNGVWTKYMSDGVFNNSSINNLYDFNDVLHTTYYKIVNATPLHPNGTIYAPFMYPTTASNTDSTSVGNRLCVDSLGKMYVVGGDTNGDIVVLEAISANNQYNPSEMAFQNPIITTNMGQQPIAKIIAPPNNEPKWCTFDNSDDLYVQHVILINDVGWETISKLDKPTNTWSSLIPSPQAMYGTNFVVDNTGDIIFVGYYIADAITSPEIEVQGVFRVSGGVVTQEGAFTDYDLTQSIFGFLRFEGSTLHCSGTFYNTNTSSYDSVVTLSGGNWTCSVTGDSQLAPETHTGFVIDSLGNKYISTATQTRSIVSGVETLLSTHTGAEVYLSINNDQIYLYELNYYTASFYILTNGVWVIQAKDTYYLNFSTPLSFITHDTFGGVVSRQSTDTVIQYSTSKPTSMGTFYGYVDSLAIHNGELFITSRSCNLGDISHNNGVILCYDLTSNVWKLNNFVPSNTTIQLLKQGADLYMTGSFDNIKNDYTINRIAKYENNQWVAVGDSTVLNSFFAPLDITKQSTTLYMCGTTSGGE